MSLQPIAAAPAIIRLPTNDLESAIIRTLTPAAFTAIVRGVNDTTGIAVVEVYPCCRKTGE